MIREREASKYYDTVKEDMNVLKRVKSRKDTRSVRNAAKATESLANGERSMFRIHLGAILTPSSMFQPPA